MSRIYPCFFVNLDADVCEKLPGPGRLVAPAAASGRIPSGSGRCYLKGTKKQRRQNNDKTTTKRKNFFL